MKQTLIMVIGFTTLLLSSCSSNNGLPGGSGMIEATQSVVSAESSGRLLALRFGEGDPIEYGDTIAQIDTTKLALQIRQAEAGAEASRTRQRLTHLDIQQAEQNLQLASKEFDRVSRLLKSGTANQQQYDKVENTLTQAKLVAQKANAALVVAKADLNQAEAQLALLREMMGDCFPTAPVSGIITDKYVEVGELVGPGKALLEITRLDTVTVKIYLPPQELSRIKLGDAAEVDPEDGRKQPLIGNVSWITSEAEFTPKNVQTRESRADLVYAVKISIANPEQELKVGMPVSVRIP